MPAVLVVDHHSKSRNPRIFFFLAHFVCSIILPQNPLSVAHVFNIEGAARILFQNPASQCVPGTSIMDKEKTTLDQAVQGQHKEGKKTLKTLNP